MFFFEACSTCEMAVLLALRVCEGHKFSEQQRIFEDPLHRLDEVGFQGWWMLFGGVPLLQELFKRPVRLRYRKTTGKPIKPNAGISPPLTVLLVYV